MTHDTPKPATTRTAANTTDAEDRRAEGLPKRGAYIAEKEKRLRVAGTLVGVIRDV